MKFLAADEKKNVSQDRPTGLIEQESICLKQKCTVDNPKIDP